MISEKVNISNEGEQVSPIKTGEPQKTEDEHKQTRPTSTKIESEVEYSSDISIPFNWNGYDALCIMILIGFSVFSRFWIIQYPRHMVYQEEKQIHIINSYLNGSFYLDTEPPLASMLMAGVAYLADYNLTYTLPRTEENYSYHDMQYVALRTTPAFFSSIVVPLSFFIVRSFGGSRLAALSAGLFTLFDFLLISLGRNIFTDGLIQFFVAFTLFLASISFHFRENSTSWIVIVFFESIFVGFSISSAVAAVGLWLFIVFMNRKSFIAIFFNLFVPIVVFIFAYCYHVTLMPYHSQYDYILSESYLVTLFNLNQRVKIDHPTILLRAFELIRLLFSLREEKTQKTDYVPSEWLNWPYMGGPWFVLWTQFDRYVSAFGNLAVWWPICLAIICCFIKICFTASVSTKSQLLFIGYVTSMLFFAAGGLNERGICDYEISLLFGLVLLPLFIDEELDETAAGFVFTALIIASAFLFILWAPLVYAYENFDQRFIPYFAHND